jgi:hypothetical protein
VSIAAFRPAGAVYREEQHFVWWLYALLALMALLGCAGPAWHQQHPGAGPNPAVAPRGWGLEVPLGLLIGLGLPALLIILVLHMTTEATPTYVGVWFGWIPTYRQIVPISGIERVEVVHFRPIADYGFWGVRRGHDGERVLIARGNRGVRLYLSNGSRLLIGSQRPEMLANAIRQAMEPGA